jgi:hypothetical protein
MFAGPDKLLMFSQSLSNRCDRNFVQVAVRPMPGSALVVIESELVFRGLKTVLDRPPMAFDRQQHFDGCCRWSGAKFDADSHTNHSFQGSLTASTSIISIVGGSAKSSGAFAISAAASRPAR